jgi:hypothetical protein
LWAAVLGAGFLVVLGFFTGLWVGDILPRWMAERLWTSGLGAVSAAGFACARADTALAAGGAAPSSAGLDISSTVCR